MLQLKQGKHRLFISDHLWVTRPTEMLVKWWGLRKLEHLMQLDALWWIKDDNKQQKLGYKAAFLK